MDYANLILDYIAAVRDYLETRKLADRLIRLLETSDNAEVREKTIASIRKISSPNW
jgi:hypothetical protein